MMESTGERERDGDSGYLLHNLCTLTTLHSTFLLFLGYVSVILLSREVEGHATDSLEQRYDVSCIYE